MPSKRKRSGSERFLPVWMHSSASCAPTLRVGVVRVVGDHEAGCRASCRSPAGRRGRALLDLDAVVHQLQEVVVLAEDVLVLAGRLRAASSILAEPQPGLHLAGGAAGGGDQPLGVLGDGSLSIRGHLRQQPSSDAREEPEEVVQAGRVRAQIVLWV